MAHLWTGAECPPEYTEFILKRDVYGCTTSELRKERAADVLRDLACLQVEVKVKNERQRASRGRRGGKR